MVKRGAAAIGVIGRNSDGKPVDGRGCCVPASSPLQSEILAIREACLLIRHQHFLNAIIELECKMAVNLCSSEATPPWDSVILIGEIKAMVIDFHIRSLLCALSLQCCCSLGC